MTMTTQTQPETAGPQLKPVLSNRWALRLEHVVLTALFATLLLMLNYMPLRNTDLWGHVLYGQWIVDHQALPSADPFLQLSEGVPVIDSAWLAQTIFAQVEAHFGPQGLANLFALLVWGSFVVLARAFYLQSRRISLTIAGTLLVLVVGWSRVATIRPENFAVLLFAVLLWLIVGARFRKDREARWPLSLWFGVPVVFALWANLHGSFFCGLALLGCYWLGSVIDVAWRERSLGAVLADRDTRRWLYLCELATVATLLNPYGIDLLVWTLQFSSHPNMGDVAEWQSLVVLGTGGVEFCLAIICLLVVLRHSRRRVAAADVLLLALFALLSASSVRMLGWFAPVFAIVLVPHLDELLDRLWPRAQPAAEPLPEGQLAPGQSWRYSLVCATLVWIAFAFSAFSAPLLGATDRSESRLYDPSTPRAVSAWLRENPIEGLVVAPQWWSDWLIWDGPEGFQPMVTTNMHLVPRQVWNDYRRITMATGTWEELLDRYKIDTLIIDREKQPLLASAVTHNLRWVVRFQDDQSMVVTRVTKRRAAK